MKIGLLTSYRGQDGHETKYQTMTSYLQKKGHKVIHRLNTSQENLLTLSNRGKEIFYHLQYQKLEQCDLVIAECSVQSIQLGFELAYLVKNGNKVIIISQKDPSSRIPAHVEIRPNMQNLTVIEYSKEDMLSILDSAVDVARERLDRRFTMIFPSHLMAKLETISKKKRLPKAVYVRQVLEKSFKGKG